MTCGRVAIALGAILASSAFQCLSATAQEVIEMNKPLEPVMCEALKLEGEMADVMTSSGIPAQELMQRDINEDTPVIRNIKRITERIQQLTNANMPTILRVREAEQTLSAAEREKLIAYLRDMMLKCLSR